MKIFKIGALLFFGILVGVVGTIVTFRPVIQENRLSYELTGIYPSVKEFALLANKTDQFSFCFRYEFSLGQIEILEEKLALIDYEKSGVILKMSIDGARDAIYSFNEIDYEKLKYKCQ